MKKRIIVVSLILILCSIFLFSKDTIMNNIKKLTTDISAFSSYGDSLFSRDYHIYDSSNVVEELDRKNLDLNIAVGVGKTFVDEGIFRFFDIHGVYNVFSWDDFDIWSTNENVLKITAIPNGNSIKIIYEGISDGSAQIKMAFNLTTISTGEGSVYGAGNYSAASCANCTIGTVTVGNGDDSLLDKPDKPTVVDIPTTSQNGYVYVKCVTYPNSNPHSNYSNIHAGYMSMKNSEKGWSFGEVYANDGRFGTDISKTDYPWFCDLTLDKDWYLYQFNRNFSSKWETHYLADSNQVKMTFVSDGTDWYYFEEDVPLVVWTTHNAPVSPTYTVTYTDGVEGEIVFADQEYEGLSEGDKTPAFEEETGKTQVLKDGTVIPIREGYTFQGWSPSINPIIEAADADENGEIIYNATWQKKQSGITEINKEIVKRSNEVPSDISISGISYPNADGKIVIPSNDSVEVLYCITVIGTPGTKYKVTDVGSTYVGGDPFMGTIPETGKIVVYVVKTFTEFDINNQGKLENIATVTPGEYYEPSSDSTETTPAEIDYNVEIKPKINIIWYDGYTKTPIKTEIIFKDDDYATLYPSEPTRDGYTFTGWDNPETDADGNITIMATWKENSKQTYTVIYKDKSNSFSSQTTYELLEGENTPKFKEETGKTQVLEDGTVIPIREGYRFIGWSKKINKVVSAEDANENYEIIYIAMWQKMGETTDKEENTTPTEDSSNKKDSNEIDIPLTEDKIIKYLISGIISTLLLTIIILKNKQKIKNKLNS